MDHKAFLTSLSAAQRDDLTTRSDAKGLRHLVGHWGAIALCLNLILFKVPLWQAIMVVQGVLLVFLFTLLHETSHKTPFASGWINDVVGHICGFVLFLPSNWFRYFHFAHHRFTQIPDKDPEMEAPKPQSRGEYIRHVSGIPVWISHFKTLIGNAVGAQHADYIPTARRGKIKTEARLYLAGYTLLLGLSIWLDSTVLIYIWLLPILLGQPFLRLYLLAEHGRCPTVANMFENTRTTFTNRLVRAIAWNMPFHTEHHTYPSVPFHKLPELHVLAKPHLMVSEDGYAEFNKNYIREALD
ncbi:Fatty acid desaturase [Monaibacterium marinum]|uniref:Fatty acid desaturase n=1 Tax=Pontivivens marinum TaxID=1690039 RepID=A0A2C9CSH2_9RHOB|nr:fatty acid desaturase [Monaibacterium marinum]SOH94168.1 Fatty acid desaturase [Monaibacterium marinum]